MDEFAAAMAQALADLNAGQPDRTELACRRLLHRDPDHPGVHQLLAHVLLHRRDLPTALRHAMHSLARRPEHVATLILAGKIARATGEPAMAAQHFARAHALAPDVTEAAFLFGSTLAAMGDAGAPPPLQRALLQQPQHAEAWSALGLVLKKNGDHHAALACFDRAISYAPDVAYAYFHRALILQELQQHDLAIIAFREAYRLDPGAMEVTFNLGVALHHAGELEQSRRLLEQSVSQAPSSADAWFSLGLTCQDLHDLPAAICAFRTALNHRPAYIEAAVNLGIALQESGAMDEAMAAYRVAARLRPETINRIVQALSAGSTGCVWLDLGALQHALTA